MGALAGTADEYIVGLSNELRRWPGIEMKITHRGKHRRATFIKGELQRFITVPTTGSDHRGVKNSVTQMRKAVREMTSQQRAQGASVGRFGINHQNAVFSIPQTSPFYSRFIDDPQAKWTFELRSNPAPDGQPFLALVPVPADSKLAASRATMNKQLGILSVVIGSHRLPRLKRLGTFAMTHFTAFRDEGGVLLFELPPKDQRKPVRERAPRKDKGTGKQAQARAGIPLVEARKLADYPRPEPVKVHASATGTVVEVPFIKAKRPDPEPAAEPDPEAAPAPLQSGEPTPLILPANAQMVLQMPRETISLERAVNVINAHKKRLGYKLKLAVVEGGYLSAHAKLGEGH